MNIEEIKKPLIISLAVLIVLIGGYFGISILLRGSGDIKIETVPTEAKIYLDGEEYKTPITLKELDAGMYKLKVTKDGFRERTEQINVTKGKKIELVVWLYSTDISPATLRQSLHEDSKSLSEYEKLIQYLPTSNLHYKIEYVVINKTPTIKITLYAILNRAEQLENYKKQLKGYGQEALDWIKSKNINTEKLTIRWLPSDPFKEK